MSVEDRVFGGYFHCKEIISLVQIVIARGSLQRRLVGSLKKADCLGFSLPHSKCQPVLIYLYIKIFQYIKHNEWLDGYHSNGGRCEN